MKGLLLTYAMTYGGAAASIVYPYVGLLIYISFAILKPDQLWYWSVAPGNYSRIIAISLLAGWVGKGFGDWRFFQAQSIATCLIAYWIWMAIGCLFVQYSAEAAYAYLEANAKIVLPFLVGLTLINSLRQLQWLAWTIMLSQAYVAYRLNSNYYEGYNTLYFEGFAGFDNNCVAIAMVTGTGLALFLGLNSEDWRQKAICVVCSLLMIHCVLFSFSRGGMLALCLTGIFGFILIPKRLIHYLVFACVIVLGLRLAGPEVRDRFIMTFADEETRDESAQSRLDLWEDALDTMQRAPVFGVGPEQWSYVAPEYGWGHGKRIHSLWLQTGAELGYPGMLLLLAFYSLCLWRLLPYARGVASIDDPWIRALSSAVVVSIVGFIISAQFVSLTLLEIPYYIVLLGAGILRVVGLAQTDPTVLSNQSPWHA